MNQCAAERYKKSDAQLNEVYGKLVGVFQKHIADAAQEGDPDQRSYGQRGLTYLRQAQRAWIAYRDAHCTAARQEYEGGSISSMIFSLCLAEVTEHRIQELKSTYHLELNK